MKKLNATNAIVILSLGLTLSVVVAGCGGGNDTGESAVTKNAKAGSSDGGAGGGSTTSDTKTGSSDGGAGGGSTTSDTKTGSSDGGTGKSVTVSNSEMITINPETAVPEVSLTNAQMNSLTSAQWEEVDVFLSASQVASIPIKTIKNLSTAVLEGLSAAGTAALTDAQLNSMSKEQLNALVNAEVVELTEAQLVTVNARLKKLG